MDWNKDIKLTYKQKYVIGVVLGIFLGWVLTSMCVTCIGSRFCIY